MDTNLLQYWGKELISFAILVPIVWFFIKQNQKNFDNLILQSKIMTDAFVAHTLEDAKSLSKIFNALELHRDEAHIEFERIASNSLKTSLTEEQTIDLLKTNMWYVSAKKLDLIKSIMLNNHIKDREDIIREKVSTGLEALSDEYISKFATYSTPIGDLGIWLNKTFTEKDFNQLVDEIVKIIYRNDTGETSDICNNKLSEISLYMKTLQTGLANKLRKDLIIKRK